MKKKLFLVFIMLLGIIVLSGCSPMKWLQADGNTSLNASNNQKLENDPPEKVIADTDEMVNQIVGKINAGEWNQAITTGEAAYAAFSKAELIIKKEKVPVPGMEAVKERLLETLVEAYDYKNTINELNEKEKELYIRTAREHLKITPGNPYKKLALSQVLLAVGQTSEGFKLASELNKLPAKTKDMTENYAWGLYLTGKKTEAYNIYKTFYLQSETLAHLYHSAVVVEEFDKLLGLVLYYGCEGAGNNLMVIEPNAKNLSAQSSINTTITKAQKARDRLLVGGFRIDSKFDLEKIDAIIKAIVSLSEKK
ncbi:MAG TPA: hypothetical protein VNT57_03050 [Desulfobacteria bacterium]|nr:hypothetical protein [Desulfobacteria bacterium]